MSTLNGLPAHVLLVHAIVVLLPMAAALLVLTAAWPAGQRRFAGPNALLSLFVLVLVPITTDAGEWLQRRIPSSDVLENHTQLGDTALYVAVPVAVLAVVIWWRGREAGGAAVTTTSRRTFLAPLSKPVTIVIIVLAVLVAGSAIYDTYRIGDSGAKASWGGTVSSAPASGESEN